jgi:two-component system, NarL family, nitrate/nitrite response regulator NarL
METQSRIAVMIASDHPIMRDGLRLRIQQEKDMYVICDAGESTQLLREFALCRPDVVVVDLHLPSGTGLRAVSRIRALSPTTPVVVLANYPGELPDPRAPGHGPTVVVSKISANEQIISAIRNAVATT